MHSGSGPGARIRFLGAFGRTFRRGRVLGQNRRREKNETQTRRKMSHGVPLTSGYRNAERGRGRFSATGVRAARGTAVGVALRDPRSREAAGDDEDLARRATGVRGGRNRVPGTTSPGSAAVGGGPGAKRSPDIGDGGCTPGAAPGPGGAATFCGRCAGPSGAGGCCARAPFKSGAIRQRRTRIVVIARRMKKAFAIGGPSARGHDAFRMDGVALVWANRNESSSTRSSICFEIGVEALEWPALVS